ncbi:MAG TPA: glycoside hydrolase family 15 protein [Acidimicrobiales bacterium]|jgi:GH15 family glucan-1,4-alpha-glucosidase|nr:glycoside hydrolase family 15 protein [Acidimicrobiales bacterium]
MTLPIEDYGLIGDLHTAALVGRDCSIDWLCLPRFDSAASFAKLLGDNDHGRWKIAPKGSRGATHRRYRGETLVLESEFVTREGTVRVVDCMPIRQEHPEVVRLVEGVRGKVTMEMSLIIRFGYGQIVPWVRRTEGTLSAIAGPDGLSLWTPIESEGRDLSTVAEFTVSEGQRVPFSLTWFPASEDPPRPVDAGFAIQDTELWWSEWSSQCTYDGEYREAVIRSLITLKALTYEPTGGIVAAATTSLPETLGGSRNWDYRFCWLRDATLTLESLMRGGFYDEAMSWRNWLLRASAGDPSQMQIMYGAAGERRLDEWEIDWLPGYERSAPVRIGNAAAGQFQLDVYGEVMSALYESAQGCETGESAWEFQLALMEFLGASWREPDDGIWEVRGPRRHFTHSKVMAWVAIDRAIKTAEEFNLEGPLDRWKEVREEIFDQVCDLGFNTAKGSFSQYYGSDELDASLLMIPLVGFLPAHDPRVRGTIEAVERELMDGGFVLRYRTNDTGDVDGLRGREGAFLACSFWLADCLSMLGRDHDAHQLLDRLIGLRNDLGLLSEEYDPVAGRLVGNFPQAFSHVSLVNSASKITGEEKPSARHVITGLAQRSLARKRSRGGVLRKSGLSARDMFTTLAGNAGSAASRDTAALVFRDAAAVPPRPTTPPNAKRRVRTNAKARANSGSAPASAPSGKRSVVKKAATAGKKARATRSGSEEARGDQAAGSAKRSARPRTKKATNKAAPKATARQASAAKAKRAPKPARGRAR